MKKRRRLDTTGDIIDDLFSQAFGRKQMVETPENSLCATVASLQVPPQLNTRINCLASCAPLVGVQCNSNYYAESSATTFNSCSYEFVIPSSDLEPVFFCLRCSGKISFGPSGQCTNIHFGPYCQLCNAQMLTRKSYRKEAILRWKAKRLHSLPRSRVKQQHHANRNLALISREPNECNLNFPDERGIQPITRRSFLDFISESPFILPHEDDCPHCGAKKFFSETANLCCGNGEVVLAQNMLSEALVQLLTSSSQDAKSFRTYLRTYNNFFSFTSFGVKYDKELSRRNKGIYTFRVQRQVYHFLNDLMPSNGVASNLQLYFYDTENELSNRLASSPRLLESVAGKIMAVLEAISYARFFRSLKDVPNLENYRIVLKTLPVVDQRVYNKPTTSQVATLWVEGEENGETSHRDIRVYMHSGLSRNIEYYYGYYDPLQYPLILPFGELGWHQEIPKKGPKQLDKKGKRKENAASCIHPASCNSVDDLLRNEENVMATLEDDPNFVPAIFNCHLNEFPASI